MSNWDELREEFVRIAAEVARSARESTKKTLRSSGDSLRRLQHNHVHERVALGSRRALERLGEKLENGAPTWETKVQKALQAKSDKPAKYIADSIRNLGRSARHVAPVVGATVGGATGGLIQSTSGLCDLSITEADLAEMERRCSRAAKRAERITTEQNAIVRRAVAKGNKGQLLDTLTVGGITLASAMQAPGTVPAEIEQAYALAYPRMAEGGATFSDAISEKSPEELLGLISGVKGKLFEMQLVDQLNQGQLDEGLHAALAASPTQSGYDIQILNENGAVVEELQAKATESVSHVREALERYPAVDVMATSEVYGKLLESGATLGVVNSGISEAALQSQVQAAASTGVEVGLEDLAPSALGLALIAISTFGNKNIPLEERGSEFGDRGARVAVASSLGGGALLATGIGALGIIVGIGSHSASNVGTRRRQRYEALKAIAERLEGANQRSAPHLIRSRRIERDQAIGSAS